MRDDDRHAISTRLALFELTGRAEKGHRITPPTEKEIQDFADGKLSDEERLELVDLALCALPFEESVRLLDRLFGADHG